MSRITNYELAGKVYPLNFSLKASKEVAARYGTVEGAADAISERSTEEALDEISWILALLMDQGAKYVKITEDRDVEPLSKDNLEIVLGMADISSMRDTLFGAMTAGMDREVLVEIDPKNAETTQSK